VIGTGSSGVQIVAELGRRGHDVTHFMRTPQWIQVKANPPIRWYEKMLLGVPGMARFWDWNMGRIKRKTDGPESWKLEPGPDRDRVEQQFLRTLTQEVTDPLLRQKLTPTYALGCKRIPKSPDFYRIIQQPNVHPVFGSIQRIEPRGIVDADGTLHELDVIVYATGFDSHAYMRPMKVIGADGVTIDNLWNDSVYSYRGVGLPSMPNFFLLSGPFAPVNSIAVHASLSDEVGFLMRLLDVIRTTGDAYAPTEAATQRFLRDVGEAMPATTYASCEDSWYRDRGGLPVVWPFTRQRHRDMFQQLELEDFERFPVSRPAPAEHAEVPTGQ
jgi:cation diffusion facilitator CzcD-associated flavoprotein CzcO